MNTRKEIFASIDRLQQDIRKEETPLTLQQRVYKYSMDKDHALFLRQYPRLFRSVCKGSYRPEVVNILLDARDQLEQGVCRQEVLDHVVRRSVEEVKSISKTSRTNS